MEANQYPNARITKVEKSQGVNLITIRCPYCRKGHRHGGGSSKFKPELGHRTSHCTKKKENDKGYNLAFLEEYYLKVKEQKHRRKMHFLQKTLQKIQTYTELEQNLQNKQEIMETVATFVEKMGL